MANPEGARYVQFSDDSPNLNAAEAMKQKDRESEAARDCAVNIIETLREPLVVLDASFHVQSANRAFYEVFHVTPEAVLGRSIFSVAEGRWETPAIRSVLEELRDKRTEFYDVELEVNFPDSGRRSLLVNGRRLFQSNAAATELNLIALADNTAKKQAEEARRRIDNHMQAIVECAAEGIITIDEKGTIRSFNRAASQIFGYQAEEVVGLNIRMLMPAPYCDEHDRYLANYSATRVKTIIGVGREVLGRRKTGATFPMLLAVSEIVEEDRPTFTGLVRDISDLREAQERALQAERLAAIGEAMTGLTHESRNALQRMQSCLEMLSFRVTDNPEAIELIARLQMAQDELHQLYEEVRQYASPVAARRDRCDIGKILREAWTDALAVDATRIAHLYEQGTDLDLVCKVNRFSLHQVFRNILENSLAACADPTEIDVRYSECRLDGDPALSISICDNGSGFTEEQARRVFEPFYSTKTKGTGLGMAIVRRIVAVHGGRVDAGNSDKSGAKVIVTLPRSKL